ncbi:MAG TPA: enoyl-CoA hydratase-related protein [Acidimicrobiales bacterium]|jgi:enoyl-CoA hydratase/carnithine racemase|nr:enoyl-CoA hydratase-related protein [Acidimicrobiales bacterium]
MSGTRTGSVAEHVDGEVKVSVQGRVARVTIDRPSKKNALTQAMYKRIADALLEADSDPDIGAVVITGVDDVFTAGNDLADFMAGNSLDETHRFLDAIATVHVPVIAAVNGLAIGVGLTLLLHCDLVFVEPSADLSAPFVGLGLVPEAASSLLLPRVVGERRASEIFLTGRHLSGSEAAEWGLANAAATPVLPAAVEAAERVAAQPHAAARTSKSLLRSHELTVEGRMAEEMAAFADALKGSEFAAVMAARRAR